MHARQALFRPAPAVAMVLCQLAFSATAQLTPYVHTQPAGPVSASNATLNGAVVPNGLTTSVWFEWGTNHSYSQTSAVENVGSGSAVRFVRTDVTGLATNGVFQCRLVASNAAGVATSHPHYFITGGRLAAWGSPQYGRLRLPKSEGGFVTVAGGISADNVVLKNDGAVRVLSDSAMLTNVPVAATNIAGVAVGFSYCLALRSNHTALGWPGTYFYARVYSNIVALAAGGTHSLALRATGRVVGDGDNSSGQLSTPAAATNLVAISAGYEHSAALRADGRVLAWGDNTHGQINVPSMLSNVVAIACGFWHTFALKRDGTVATWGSDVYGLGYLNVPTGLSNVVVIAAGKYHNLALRSDGTVVAWGGNESGQATVPIGLNGVVGLAGNIYHSAALAPNLPPQVISTTAVGAANHDLVVALEASDLNNDDVTLRITALPEPGMLYQFATNGRGTPITLANTVVSDPLGRVIFAPQTDAFGNPYADFEFVADDGEADSSPGTIELVILGPPHAHTLPPGPLTATTARLRGLAVANGLPTTVWFEWGSQGSLTETTPPQSAGNSDSVGAVYAAITNLVSNQEYTCRLVASNAAGVVFGPKRKFITGGRVAGWGRSDNGQLQPPAGLADAVAVAGGVQHSLALTTEGGLVQWGYSESGHTNAPPDLSDIAVVAAGAYYSAVVGLDGQPRVWGNAGFGSEVTNVPAGLNNVVALACGGAHLLALREDGTLVAWGSNSSGQTNVPARASNVVAVAAGAYHSLALRADGSLVAWGYGQLGQTAIPAGLSNVVDIACGEQHCLALTANGRVVAWGYNGSGQTNVPPGLSNVVALAAGAAHSVALLDTGELQAWGNGSYGQNTVPPELLGTAVLAAGSSHNLTIGANVRPVASAQAVSGIANHDLVITLAGGDLNGDALSFRITKLPVVGSLYQFDTGNRGALILAPDTVVADTGGRIIFVPTPNGLGQGYANVEFRASDGELDSPPASVTISIEGTTYVHSLPPIVRQGTATLSGGVTPNGYPTTMWFEWGNAGAAGGSTPAQAAGTGGGLVRVSTELTNLVSGGTYWYRLVASNSTGIVRGAKQLFTTRGQLVVWGRDVDMIPLIPPPVLDRVVTVAAGRSHAVALNRDGTVSAFPMDAFGQSSVLTNVPGAATNVVAVAAGVSHSLAVKADGRVVAWGNNSYGQTSVPANLTNVVAVTAGSTYSVALKNDGVMVIWGSASPNYGQANVPAGLSNVVAVAAGNEHNIALKDNGTVVAWGRSNSGQTNVPVGLTEVTAVAAGEAHNLALRADGTIVAWGSNWYGQTNVPTGLSNVVAIAAGDAHSLALREDGSIVGWGSPVGSMPPTNLTVVTAIAAKSNFGLAVEPLASIPPYVATQPAAPILGGAAVLNGAVAPRDEPAMAWFEWGTSGDLSQRTPPQALAAMTSLVRVSSPVSNLTTGVTCHYRLVASNAFGTAYGGVQLFSTGNRVAAWGYNNVGQALVPRHLTNAIAVAAGPSHSGALRNDGTLAAWGAPLHALTNTAANMSNVMAVAIGESHMLALTAEAKVLAWGNNSSGQTNRPAGLSNVIAVAAGGQHSLALRADGRVFAWGANSLGQANVPSSLTDVVAIAAGSLHNLALKADGRVVAWGSGGLGQTNVPPGLSNVVAIAASSAHSLALKSDGGIVVWGGWGAVPQDPPSNATNVIEIAAGGSHFFARRADGAVVTWGRNDYGQATLPVGMVNVSTLAGGALHSLAIADNVPPQVSPRTVSGGANTDLLIALSGSDVNNNPITLRIATEPAAGRLYQYNAGARGAPITEGTTIADFAHRLVFAPAANRFGNPYTMFNYIAHDGEMTSASAAVTVNLSAPVTPLITSRVRISSGAFQLGFTGHSNTTYCVWASTNLVDWERLDFPTQPTSGIFSFLDPLAATLPQRFYRISTGCDAPLPALSHTSAWADGQFNLHFAGGPYWTYRVWASTNLVNWELIGAADETIPGQFQFRDIDSAKFPRRFYKAGAP